jgi:hypothetical protein
MTVVPEEGRWSPAAAEISSALPSLPLPRLANFI